MSVLDTLNSASPRTRTVPLILNAALWDQWESLARQLEAAAAADEDRGSLAMPETTRIINEMEEIREAVDASRVEFVFEPIDWTERLNLQALHPPRPGKPVDQIRGFNIDTYVPALIKECCVKVIDGNGDEATDIPDATWDRLLGNPDTTPPTRPTLVHGQVQELYSAAESANQGESRVPTSARFLLETQDSGASLAQPGPGKAPHQNGSEDGSPSGSPSTSTTTTDD